MSDRRTAIAVMNPSTGNAPPWRVRRVLERAARDARVDLEIIETEYPDHATEIVRERVHELDMVLAVGGDGTLSEVVAGVVGTEVIIGIIPTGSTNMVAKDLGIPRSLSQAARVALRHDSAIIALDVAKAGDTTFMHMGGAGYDATIMREANKKLKRVLRWVAYVGPGLQQLRTAPFQAHVTVDETEFDVKARMILVAIGGSIVHPRFVVGDGIDRTDGILDVVIFDPPSLYAIFTTLSWVILRQPWRSRWQTHLRGTSVKLESDQKVPYELDGSYRGELPISFEMLDSGVRVAVPAVPTPGEIEAHLNARYDFNEAEIAISGRRNPV